MCNAIFVLPVQVQTRAFLKTYVWHLILKSIVVEKADVLDVVMDLSFNPPLSAQDFSPLAARLRQELELSHAKSAVRLDEILSHHVIAVSSSAFKLLLRSDPAAIAIQEKVLLSYGGHGAERDGTSKRDSDASVSRFFGSHSKENAPGTSKYHLLEKAKSATSVVDVAESKEERAVRLEKERELSEKRQKQKEAQKVRQRALNQLRKDDPGRTSPSADADFTGEPLKLPDPDEKIPPLRIPEAIHPRPPSREYLLNHLPEILYRFKGYTWQRGQLTQESKRKLGFYWLRFESDGLQYECNLHARRYAKTSVHGGWALPKKQPTAAQTKNKRKKADFSAVEKSMNSQLLKKARAKPKIEGPDEDSHDCDHGNAKRIGAKEASETAETIPDVAEPVPG